MGRDRLLTQPAAAAVAPEWAATVPLALSGGMFFLIPSHRPYNPAAVAVLVSSTHNKSGTAETAAAPCGSRQRLEPCAWMGESQPMALQVHPSMAAAAAADRLCFQPEILSVAAQFPPMVAQATARAVVAVEAVFPSVYPATHSPAPLPRTAAAAPTMAAPESSMPVRNKPDFPSPSCRSPRSRDRSRRSLSTMAVCRVVSRRSSSFPIPSTT